MQTLKLSPPEPGTFPVGGLEYAYFYHPYNVTWRNERAVEIPIIREYIDAYAGDKCLEVGNVMRHYYPAFEHTDVVDKYEKGDGVINCDIVDWQPGYKYKLIYSVSTLEHIGWDEDMKIPYKLKMALTRLRLLLDAGGTLIATAPLGYNRYLDDLVKTDGDGFNRRLFLRRVSDNKWAECSKDEAFAFKYSRVWKRANAIMVGIDG